MPLIDRKADLDDHLVTVLELRVAHAESPVNIVFGDYQRVALSGGDVDSRALADEIIAEALDLDVRDDPTLFDLRIDEDDAAASQHLLVLHLKTSRSDQDRIAGLHEAGRAAREAVIAEYSC